MASIKVDMEGEEFPTVIDSGTEWSIAIDDQGAEHGLRVRLYLPEFLSTGGEKDYEGCGIVFVSLTTLFDEFMAEAWGETGFPSSKWFPAYLRSLADRMESLPVEKAKEQQEWEAAKAEAESRSKGTHND